MRMGEKPLAFIIPCADAIGLEEIYRGKIIFAAAASVSITISIGRGCIGMEFKYKKKTNLQPIVATRGGWNLTETEFKTRNVPKNLVFIILYAD
jgi:hypothetical protein